MDAKSPAIDTHFSARPRFEPIKYPEEHEKTPGGLFRRNGKEAAEVNTLKMKTDLATGVSRCQGRRILHSYPNTSCRSCAVAVLGR